MNLTQSAIALMVVLALIGAAWGYHVHAVHVEQAKTTKALADLAVARNDNLALAKQLDAAHEAKAAAEANAQKLAAQLAEQTAAVRRLKAEAAAISAQADARVADALRHAERQRAAAVDVAGAGPEVMNQFFVSVFTP